MSEQNTNSKWVSTTSPEPVTAGTPLVSEVLYKKPIVYMVPLHEVSEITQEDWFFESLSIICSGALGIVLEAIFNNSIKNISIEMKILGGIAIIIVASHIGRLISKNIKIENLKKKAVPFPFNQS